MQKIFKVFDVLLNKLCCWIFIVITFFYAILRTPFYDEAYGFMISQLPFNQIFQLIPIEGHPIGWYLLLKIFCSNAALYPYPMLIMNWAIFSIFIYIFWKKAPFNGLIKFLVTFSYLFLNYYAIFARPYGLAILVLMLLTCLYNESSKRPFLYAFLIIISLNICSVSMFGACAYSVIFLYKLYKDVSRRRFVEIIALLFFGVLLSALQFIGVKAHYVILTGSFIDYIKYFLIPDFSEYTERIIFCITRTIFIFYIPYILFKKCKIAFYFVFISYFLLAYLALKIYPVDFWHYYFYFIYFIIGLMLAWDKLKDDKFLNVVLVLLLISLLFPKTILSDPHLKRINTTKYQDFIVRIKALNKLKASKFFNFDWFSPLSSGIIPYLNKDNIFIYDAHNLNKNTFESMKNTYKYKLETFNGENFIKYIDDNKENFLLTSGVMFLHGDNYKAFKFAGQDFYYKNILKFEMIYYDSDSKYAIFRIKKLNM